MKSEIYLEVGGLYRLNFGGSFKTDPTKGGALSSEFSDKYPVWGDVDGKIVKILRIRPGDIRLYLEGDSDKIWVDIRPEFLIKLSKNVSGTCQCDIWITGCNCGIFKAEQNS